MQVSYFLAPKSYQQLITLSSRKKYDTSLGYAVVKDIKKSSCRKPSLPAHASLGL